MSLMHPIGPERSETYWVRRGLVVAAALVAIILMGVIAAKAADRSTPTTAQPAPSAGLPTFASTPDGSASSTPAEQSASPSASPSPTVSASPSASGSPTVSGSATPSASATGTATTPAPSTSKSSTSTPVVCDPAKLRTTLTSATHRVHQRQPVALAVSVINGSDGTCKVSVSADVFELKVYSGTDRIWSTDDCRREVAPIRRNLGSSQAVAWKQTWNGLRSRSACQVRPEVPMPGTYYVTAQLKGAAPVQWRLQVIA